MSERPPSASPQVSICLECNSSKLRGLKRKWIRCSAQATVLHLKKFIAKKLNLSSFNEVACAQDTGEMKCLQRGGIRAVDCGGWGLWPKGTWVCGRGTLRAGREAGCGMGMGGLCRA